MDPNAALENLRRLISINGEESHADEIAEQFEALDEWLSAGGFLPEAWRGELKRRTKMAVVDELRDRAHDLDLYLLPAAAQRLRDRARQLGGGL